MEIKSRAFNNMGSIPERYTCDGDNINPPLEILDIPNPTKSLALIVDDPDAPNGTWVHWLMWDIPIENHSIKEGEPPVDCVYGTNSFARLEYGGPCPPSGTHRYFFKVYALSKTVQLPEGATKEELMSAIGEYKIDSAQLVGLYSRNGRGNRT
ncbi:MAG: YbhB/YbcL family Raf kinase inhibitor-like protein [Candidatus Dojkabacteria bacterium]